MLGSESNPLDNLSVLKTPERLWGAVNKINAVRPKAELVLVLGDFVHDAYYTLDYETLKHGPINAYHVTRGIVDRLNASLVMAYGNHDFEARAGTGYFLIAFPIISLPWDNTCL